MKITEKITSLWDVAVAIGRSLGHGWSETEVSPINPDDAECVVATIREAEDAYNNAHPTSFYAGAASGWRQHGTNGVAYATPSRGDFTLTRHYTDGEWLELIHKTKSFAWGDVVVTTEFQDGQDVAQKVEWMGLAVFPEILGIPLLQRIAGTGRMYEGMKGISSSLGSLLHGAYYPDERDPQFETWGLPQEFEVCVRRAMEAAADDGADLIKLQTFAEEAAIVAVHRQLEDLRDPLLVGLRVRYGALAQTAVRRANAAAAVEVDADGFAVVDPELLKAFGVE